MKRSGNRWMQPGCAEGSCRPGVDSCLRHHKPSRPQPGAGMCGDCGTPMLSCDAISFTPSQLWVLLLIAFGVTSCASLPAHGGCPEDVGCEIVRVYRVQTWPGLLADASGVDMLSLREANAGDAGAFRELIKAYAGSDGRQLALRFDANRITSAPNYYCNCNFEYRDKACKPPIDDEDLRQCARTCRYGGQACAVAGRDAKDTGTAWYAFPAHTECTGPERRWKRNAFGIDPRNCDWQAGAAVIKRAACIADVIGENPDIDLDDLFDNEQPCETLSRQTLEEEAITRTR